MNNRGLDIKNVDYIFSIDIPEDAKSYLHRAGRTTRAGKEGVFIWLSLCKFGVKGKIGGEKGILENVVVIGVSDESNPN